MAAATAEVHDLTHAVALTGLDAGDADLLHVNVGRHGEIPAYERDGTLRFLTRHLV
ncbi:hypothetical protein [Streptomyces sp. LN704]|uniref:hypothetical protein n=1 Tax=unclassified Streptomyces TaxID=2593676 RepID=UPI003710E52C